jgi:hypothetical protein
MFFPDDAVRALALSDWYVASQTFRLAPLSSLK